MVGQPYDIYVEMEHVILGNDALLKCKIPSHVTDFVSVSGWVDNEGKGVLLSASTFMNNGTGQVLHVFPRSSLKNLGLKGQGYKPTNLFMSHIAPLHFPPTDFFSSRHTTL